MAYKRYTSKRRYVAKRKFKSRRKSMRNKRNPMQKMASAGIRMKYTTVFTPNFTANTGLC